MASAILGGLWSGRHYLPVIMQALKDGSADGVVRAAVNSDFGSEMLGKLEVMCEAAHKLKRIYGRGSRLRNVANKAIRRRRRLVKKQRGGIFGPHIAKAMRKQLGGGNPAHDWILFRRKYLQRGG